MIILIILLLINIIKVIINKTKSSDERPVSQPQNDLVLTNMSARRWTKIQAHHLVACLGSKSVETQTGHGPEEPLQRPTGEAKAE